MDKDTKTWAMLLHFSVLAGLVVPVVGLLAPILIWQLKKSEMPELDAHGKTVLNFMICMLIASLISSVLMFVVIGIFLFMALAVIGVVYPIMGGIKANEGELWSYPGVIQFVK